MATHFSSTMPVRPIFHTKLNPPKSLLVLPDFYHRSAERAKCRPICANVCKWSSTASYVRLVKFSGKPVVVKQLVHKRAGVARCATTEEIEAEKSAIEKDVKARMEKTIENVRTNFNSVRTGRANPAMFDKIQNDECEKALVEFTEVNAARIMHEPANQREYASLYAATICISQVEYYGTPVGLKSIAQISTPDASSLLVQPYDKSSLKAIEKAIVNSDIGLTPNNDGEVIRLSVPQLTSERRKEMSKVVAKQAEEGKVALRNIRRDALKAYEKLEKEKKLSEDNVKDLSSDLQKLTDEYMKKIDNVYKQKEKELLKV